MLRGALLPLGVAERRTTHHHIPSNGQPAIVVALREIALFGNVRAVANVPLSDVPQRVRSEGLLACFFLHSSANSSIRFAFSSRGWNCQHEVNVSAKW